MRGRGSIASRDLTSYCQGVSCLGLGVLGTEAIAFLPKLNSELMKIAKTGIIKKQNASRNVSRITKKISSM